MHRVCVGLVGLHPNMIGDMLLVQGEQLFISIPFLQAVELATHTLTNISIFLHEHTASLMDACVQMLTDLTCRQQWLVDIRDPTCKNLSDVLADPMRGLESAGSGQ